MRPGTVTKNPRGPKEPANKGPTKNRQDHGPGVQAAVRRAAPCAITQEAARFLKNTRNYKIISEVEDKAQVERGGEEESLTKPAFVTRMVAG
ncbi:hypothetical protein PbDSM24746_29570 [Paenibacillus macerans]|uniref:Uncharacterized protein n=1 Tax=Paenibacillus macerans TaxID=44252 RepID=A0A090ZKQ9_PAEMA|nr:hypothetical protein DJ90_2453 [Paenibacillus macerans]GBK62953.1 hypothetical protein PbDSM24746_29570 [Paenibacillus macerans]GBK69265.1 hypothetical protein PbJCM17693_29730 [Paenibacillus macerans]